MGSPVSVVIAEIVMQEITIKTFSQDNNFMFWINYVADIISCILNDIISCILNDNLKESLDLINFINANIQFTSLVEKNIVISFLDLEKMK